MTIEASDPVSGCTVATDIYVGCSSCGASGGTCNLSGQGAVNNGCVEVQLNLGKSAPGVIAGAIRLFAREPSALLATPEALEVLAATTVKTYRSEGRLRQIDAPQAFVTIEPSDEYRYEVYFYTQDYKGTLQSTGLYELIPGAVPFASWTIENPDRTPDTTNRLRITEDRGSAVRVYEYTWDEAASTWILSEANGERVTAKAESTDANGDRVERKEVRDGLGVVASITETTYREIVCAASAREEIVRRVEDPDGFALTTHYDFYEEAEAPPAGSCGLLEEQVNPDGSWVRYEYDVEGRKLTETHSWLDAPIGAAESLARVVRFDYTPLVDSNDADDARDARMPRTVTEEVEGVGVAKTYHVYFADANGRTEIVERAANPAASYGDPANERTETVYYAFDTETIAAGKVKSELSDDGRLDSHTYQEGSYTSVGTDAPGTFSAGTGSDVLEILTHGTASNPSGIAYKSTIEKRITDAFGNRLQEETWVYTEGGSERIGWVVYTLDEFGRPLETHRSDGTVTESTWTCCGKDADTDRVGTHAEYGHDDLGRVRTATRYAANGTTVTTYDYDAEGRVLGDTVSGGDLVQSTSTQYDAAGRLWIVADAANRVTTYDYSDGGRTSTVTHPGGATEVTQHYLDGRVKSVTGSAVVARYYEYGVHRDGTQWTRVNTGSPLSAQWEVTTVDALGRTVTLEKPAFAGGSVTTEQFYNDFGQLERTTAPGQADSLYEYDELGGLSRAGLDVDGSGALEPASEDRIQDTETSYVYLVGAWWRQTEQRVYPTGSDPTPVTLALQRVRSTGFGGDDLVAESVEVDIHGNETATRVAIDRSTATQVQTTDFPDATMDAVETSVDGLAATSQSKSGVTLSYGYDELGRRTHTTDPRTGTSVLHYNDHGQVEWLEDPAGNRTTYTYDPASGRLATETNARGHVTRYAYDARGQVTHIWGDAAIPVRYVYDGLGRKVEMHTYRDEAVDWNTAEFPAAPGVADVTLWHHEPGTGLLAAKEDAAGQGAAYAYTPAGKLATRTWARTNDGAPLVTTYGYDPATAELTSVDYSDATPDVVLTYDRLGRQATITDAVGMRVLSYDLVSLQLIDEAITGLYDLTLTRHYQDSTGVPGRSAGLTIDTVYAVEYTYEPDTGRFGGLSWVVGADTGSLTYSYLADSDLLHQKTVADGPVTTLAYEPLRNLPTQVQHQSIGAVVAQYDYQYNELAQRESVQLSGRSFAEALTAKLQGQAWFEDAEPTADGIELLPESRTYSYDPIGNRLNASDWDPLAETARETTYTANALNQYDDFTPGMAPPVLLDYDADGNLVGWNDGAGAIVYRYNAENRLIAMEPDVPADGDAKVEFLYDYLGRRVRKTVSQFVSGAWAISDEILFVYDGWNLVQERHSGGTVKRSYVWGLDLSGSLQGAGGIGGLVFSTDGLTGYHYLYDANGNVGQLVDANTGAVVAHYEYDPFGRETYASGGEDNRFRFSTKYADAETGLVYYGYRYYSPELGRWLTRDPIEEEGGLNLYGFVGNSPVGDVDPFGQFSWLRFVACFTGMSMNQAGALRGGVTKEMLRDPLVQQEVSAEIAILKQRYGKSWKKVRKKIIYDVRKRAVEKVVRRLGRSAFVKWLGNFVIGKIIPVWGQVGTAWDACKAVYCFSKAI